MQQNKNKLFINRELSWLEFNRRVLELARDKNVPLGEQFGFASIYGSNLDEFFMVRVGSLVDQTLLKAEVKENKTNLTARQQLSEIMPKVAALQKICDKNVNRLFEKLGEYSIRKVDFTNISKEHEAFWKKYFTREMQPVLSPQIIDQRHPFPFLRNREIYVGAMLKSGKNGGSASFGLIPVSTQFERVLTMKDGAVTWFVLVEELILQYAHLAFGKGSVQSKSLFRVTRNADINVEEGMFDHDIDYREVMSELLRKRRKLAAVRLQFMGEPALEITDYLREKLVLDPEHCFVQHSPLELGFMRKLSGRLEKAAGDKALFYPPAKPILPPAGYNLYEVAQKRDVLVCYPYQSIRPFLVMLRRAAIDPEVISIKMTLYRVANDSQIIDALISAAENGKEVVTVVELRARFDEQNNIDWSRRLEQAGCTVIYGFSDYKVHSKLTLITKRTEQGYQHTAQIGTGNYNEKTSELYTDLSFVTSDLETCEEVATVFNNMAVERLTPHVNRLIVAPLCFKSVLRDEVKAEIRHQREGGQGRVIIKCNSISDKHIIETLSEASETGVPVDMIVRGICCLQAGLPGLSQGIKVRSIVGRYLEHSRIYAFGEGERLRVYIASGDFLTRNTERRVEVGVKIEDKQLQNALCDILHMQLMDNVNAYEMQLDGSYLKVKRAKDEARVDSQMQMYSFVEKKLDVLGYAPLPAPTEQGGADIAARQYSSIKRRLKKLLRDWLEE